VLQCAAVRCGMLQSVAEGCSVSEHTNVTPLAIIVVQRVCCGLLQHVVVYYSMLQYVAVCCSIFQCACAYVRNTSCDGSRIVSVLQCVAECCGVLQCVVVCCSMLQWVAVCLHIRAQLILRWWSHSECVAVCRRLLKCFAVSYSVMQYVAASCSVLQCACTYVCNAS